MARIRYTAEQFNNNLDGRKSTLIDRDRFLVRFMALWFKYLAGLAVIVLVMTGREVEAQVSTDEIGPSQDSALRVFLDMSALRDYVKEQIPFVNYVRDRNQAQLHILVTIQGTGGRGSEHTILFTGKKEFAGINDTLSCVTTDLDTQEYVRSEIVRIMKLGLMRYVSRTPQAVEIKIGYSQRAKPIDVADNWDYWVFGIDAQVSQSGERTNKRINYRADVTADRVTSEWKTSFGVGTSYSEDEFDTGERVIISISRNTKCQGLLVKSLGDHWSVGGYASASKSAFYNIDVSAQIAPAIEYNIFPYSQSTRRDFRFMYKVGYIFNTYEEETIYHRIQEELIHQSITVDLDVRENWGTVRCSVEGSNYVRVMNLNRLAFYASLSVRMFEGLSVSIVGRYSAIHDQIELPRRGATEEEILLRRRQLATSYDYGLAFGLSFRFGSKFSNIVNPRF